MMLPAIFGSAATFAFQYPAGSSRNGTFRDSTNARMMKLCSVALLVIAALSLSACGGQSVTLASAPLDLAGQYTGTATDSVFGSANASTTLTESGTTLTGTIALTSTTSNATLSQLVSWTVASGYTISGTANVAGSQCSFSSTGVYDTSTNVLSGKYSAVSGCSGETGTFSLTQQCTNPVSDALRRRLARPASC
jgi:hypothetical protein